MKGVRTIQGKYSSFFLISVNSATIAIIHVLLIGYTICITSGILGAAVVVAACCVILYFVVSAIMKVAICYDVSTMHIVSEYFGRKGIRLSALIIGCSFFGWFIWQINFCSLFFKYLAANHLPVLNKFSQEQITLILGVLFIGAASLGEWGLRFISLILVPCLILSLVSTVIFFSTNLCLVSHSFKMGTINLSTLSVLLSGLAAHALSTPTFYKFAMSVEDAQKSIKFVYLFILPIICSLGIILAIFSPTQDIFGLFENAKGVWPFTLMIYILLGTWTVCSLNLHYGADAIAHIFTLRDHTPVVVIAGIISIIIVCFDSQFGISTSETLGAMVVGILTVVITRTSINNLTLSRDSPQIQEGNYRALLISSLVGLVTSFNLIEITGTPFFDTAVTSFFLCIYFSKFHHRKSPRQM